MYKPKDLNYSQLMKDIKDMELFAKALGIEPFDIYFLGGSGCIIGQYISRQTFDFLDLNYDSKVGKVFRVLGDFDFLALEFTTIGVKYKERAKKLKELEYLRGYVLSREDIIASKIGRYSEKDKRDIELLLEQSDRALVLEVIEEVISREDLTDRTKENFLKNVEDFRRDYCV